MDKVSSSKTFTVDLHPRAARFNLQPLLSEVTLASILAGDTCVPISLADFEKHLTFVEYSVENLQFLVWFQDYRERYIKFSQDPTTPSGNAFGFESPSRAKAEDRPEERIANLEKTGEGGGSSEPPVSPASPADATSPTSLSPMLPPLYTQLAMPSFTHSKSNDSNTFRNDCSRAVATFLTPGATKELLLDAIVRDTVIRNLSTSCHPDVFLPVYEEIYSLLERCSVPRFLTAASVNINLPKQIYWYAVGVLNILLGILVALVLILMVPTPPHANRAYRIFPVGFFALGAGQVYSAWRGQVWMRGATQMRVWEMQELDTEAKAFVDGILNEHKTHKHQTSSLEKKPSAARSNVAAIAPFTLESQMRPGPPSVSNDTIPSYTAPASTGAMHNFNRPPIFGPEVAVLDPHIKAVHRQILIDTCRLALWFGLAFSAVVFSVPSRVQHHV
ncbi:hypothetical protein DXG01_001590 [Tephrocybe rancida]|nr:hypothetical protein DXG01_001590 [Tephrocybe rancida]